jgi:hypothetical protein
VLAEGGELVGGGAQEGGVGGVDERGGAQERGDAVVFGRRCLHASVLYFDVEGMRVPGPQGACPLSQAIASASALNRRSGKGGRLTRMKKLPNTRPICESMSMARAASSWAASGRT